MKSGMAICASKADLAGNLWARAYKRHKESGPKDPLLQGWPLQSLFGEIIRVDLGVLFPLLRHFGLIIYSIHRARSNAGSAVDADAWIDIKLRIFIIALNAVDRTHIDARFVFDGDARLADDVGQG